MHKKVQAGDVDVYKRQHLRCSKKLVLALATNDALSGNIENIGRLMQRKNVFFVPMAQDNITEKPYSLVSYTHLLRL